MDMACGALRLGQFLIPYLHRGHYIGVDVTRTLIDAGLEHELSPGIVKMKKPQFIINDSFDLSDCPPFDMAVAQSLFTHLTLDDIERCGRGLRAAARPGSVFLFTWFEGEGTTNPEGPSHANRSWWYPYEAVAERLAAGGWAPDRLGNWNHPRNQMLGSATAV